MENIKNSSSRFKGFSWSWVLMIVIVIAVGLGGYVYGQMGSKKNNVSNNKNSASVEADRKINEIVVKVGLLMELPKDETPAMITIIDKSKLTNEAFFADTQTGDQVLVYGLARKVIIYRPATNKIIEATTFILPTTK